MSSGHACAATAHVTCASRLDTAMSRRSYPLSYAVWSLAGLLSPLTASEGWTATLRASSSAPDLLGEAALWGGILAAAGAAALIAIPAVRRVVMPPPAETYLSDLLQFERVLDDGHTIRTKSGGLVQTIALRGLDVAGLTSSELDAMLIRRKAWFEKVAEAGLFAKIITTRESVSYALDAEYQNPVLQAIHDEWTAQFECVYINRDYIVVTASKDDRNASRALREAVKDACDSLAQYGPELLDNGSDAYSPLLSFWASLVNGFPYAVGSFVEDRKSTRLNSSHQIISYAVFCLK